MIHLLYISVGLYLPYIQGLFAMANVMGNFGTHARQHVAINYRDSGQHGIHHTVPNIQEQHQRPCKCCILSISTHIVITKSTCSSALLRCMTMWQTWLHEYIHIITLSQTLQPKQCRYLRICISRQYLSTYLSYCTGTLCLYLTPVCTCMTGSILKCSSYAGHSL